MNAIRYEPVFGDQRLFNGAPDDAVYVRYGRDIFIFSSEINCTVGSLRDTPIVAMRRIIRTPTWTVADQKAGKLPEVGCRIYVTMMHEEQNVIYSSEKVIVSISDNEGAVTRTEVGSIDRIKPIETPEERAKRVRNNWCADANKLIAADKDYRSESAIIYDALQSGDLPVPVKGE